MREHGVGNLASTEAVTPLRSPGHSSAAILRNCVV